jgi:hypothetical protein
VRLLVFPVRASLTDNNPASSRACQSDTRAAVRRLSFKTGARRRRRFAIIFNAIVIPLADSDRGEDDGAVRTD